MYLNHVGGDGLSVAVGRLPADAQEGRLVSRRALEHRHVSLQPGGRARFSRLCCAGAFMLAKAGETLVC